MPVRGKDGVCYDSEEVRELFEGTALKLEMTVQEVSRFVFKELLMPRAEVLKEMFTEFEEVPKPSDDVDLDATWARMRRDDRACEMIMMQNPGNWLVLEVMRVQLAWLRFAAVRWPTADGRKAFNAMMELQQVAIGVLIAKGKARRRCEPITELLEAMLAGEAVQ
jgi:hypothetical protein